MWACCQITADWIAGPLSGHHGILKLYTEPVPLSATWRARVWRRRTIRILTHPQLRRHPQQITRFQRASNSICPWLGLFLCVRQRPRTRGNNKKSVKRCRRYSSAKSIWQSCAVSAPLLWTMLVEATTLIVAHDIFFIIEMCCSFTMRLSYSKLRGTKRLRHAHTH